MFWLLIISLLGALLGAVTFVFFLNRGQFDDIEEAKFQMFRDEANENNRRNS